jgi:hypothetical protein
MSNNMEWTPRDEHTAEMEPEAELSFSQLLSAVKQVCVHRASCDPGTRASPKP